MLGKFALLGALTAGVWATQGSVQAQYGPPAQPLYGFANLRMGFVPDPHIMNGVMGGTIQASQYGNNCRGTINPQPSHVVRSPTGFRNVRFVVSGQGDSTMMVMLPNGQVLCDDDGGEGLNPLIATSSPPGEIRIWVGVYSNSNQGRPYTLGVTELSHITANNLNAAGPMPPQPPMPQPPMPPQPPMGGQLLTNAPPAFGAVSLRRGFMPDPHVVSGTAGGPVRANSVASNCRGHVTPQPSHVLFTQTGFSQLRVLVNAQLDTTLLVMLPNGQILCDDDGGQGSNPLVNLSSPPGEIRIWVGTYGSGRSGPYNIGFSELPNVTTANIPSPGAGMPGPQPPMPQPPMPQPPRAEVVDMTVNIPVTLLGPGLDGTTVALWRPSTGRPMQVNLSGRSVMAGGAMLTQLPPSMPDPVVTVMQLRNGDMVVRAEQPPIRRGDRGETALLLVTSAGGRATIQDRWTGRYGQRGPRWAR